LNPRQKREIAGLATLALGLLLGLALWAPAAGSLLPLVKQGTQAAFGIGVVFVVGAFLIAGLELLSPWVKEFTMARALGLVMLLAGTAGLLQVSSGGAGGALGQGIAEPVRTLLGGAGALIVLFATLLLGLVLAFDVSIATLVGRARQALQTRVAERETQMAARPEPAPVLPVITRLPPRPVLPEPLPPPVELTPEPVAVLAGPSLPAPVEVPIQEASPAAAVEVGAPEADEVPAVATGDAEAEPPAWVKPSLDLLDTMTIRKERLHDEIKHNIHVIEQTLLSFKVEANVKGVSSGPTVTQYELQPARGVPVRKITALTNDLSLALAALIRIQAPIPGKAAVGIEVPNKAPTLVTLREILQTPTFQSDSTLLSIALGTDVAGRPVVGDLTRMPHLLIAGATGSGKSVCINAIIAGLLFQATPEELKFILIDPKRVELTLYKDMPHLLVPVINEPEQAVTTLRWAVVEMENRYKLFASHTVRNIGDFNDRAPLMGLQPLPYLVIVIDELADLMMVAAGEIEELICRIAQLARAVGIHLVVATQRPSADIITGLIKANIPSRVAFAVSSGIDSRVVLDESGAEKLLGRGDMLYLPVDAGKPVRLQGVFVSDRELEAIINFWKGQGRPQYQEDIFLTEATVSWAKDSAGKRDPLFGKAARVVATEGRASVSLLQRKLTVGYTRAARIVDQLADHSVVGPYEGSKSREVRMTLPEVDQLLEGFEPEEAQSNARIGSDRDFRP
jgi:S-DNA-T family DNA segregation ATPase FtsK/SpoIIIE